MSISAARPAVDIDLEDYERRLRAAVAPAAGVEDPLAELARLVEASRPKAAMGGPRAPAPFAAASPPSAPLAPPPDALETGALRPALDEPVESQPSPVLAEEAQPETETPDVGAPAPRRGRRWVFTVAGLALAGVAMIGGVVALKLRAPGFQKEPPFIAAAEGPTKVQPPTDVTVSAPNDAGATLLKDDTQPKSVKVVTNEEQPVDLSAETAPPAVQPATVAPPPAAEAPAQHPAGDASGGPAVRGPLDAPVVAAAPPAAAPAPSPFPEPKPVRTISLRPDGTPIPSGDAATTLSPPSELVQAAKPAAKAPPPADAANAQSSTPKIELPAKSAPPKSSARVVVAKTDTTAPAGAADAQDGAAQPAPAKPEKAKAKPQAAAAPAAAEPAEAATSSGGWAVQLAAPRSEAEAKAAVAKLNEKYAGALNGSTLGVHKATVNGETVYRVRVGGLSKADAAALCARLKGDGGQCFVAK